MSRQLHAQTYVWLHVFSCAARHLSFTRCAEELHITPGAVSQQIRQLEERLGFRLFHRRARGVELSAEGQRLAITVNEAYGSIDAELRRLDAGMISGILRLRSIPSFLSKWLTPRLPRLQQRFPDIQLRLVAEDSSVPLHEGDFDLAIDLNDGSYPGLVIHNPARRADLPGLCPEPVARSPAAAWPGGPGAFSVAARHHRLARQLRIRGMGVLSQCHRL